MEKIFKYALYTGCTAKQSTPELLKSTLAVAEKLGIQLEILEEATCCGASHLQDFDEFLSLVLNARNLCYAEMKGQDIVTICNTCQLNLALANERLKADKGLLLRVNEKLKEVGLEYKGTVNVKHFIYVLRDDYGFDAIKPFIVRPLTDLHVAAFYGCHNLRPSTLHTATGVNENSHNPTSLDELALLLGATNVRYDSKNSCCGFHVDLQAPQTSRQLTGRALFDAYDQGADCVVTPCPLCHLNMDVQQQNVAKHMGRDIELPVLHLAQMIGIALGIDNDKLGLHHNIVNVSFS